MEEGLGEKLGLLIQWMATLVAAVIVSLVIEWRLTLLMAFAGLLIAMSTALLSVVLFAVMHVIVSSKLKLLVPHPLSYLHTYTRCCLCSWKALE